MRRILFMLMVVLLPLRGWVGDAMALQMALPGNIAHVSAPGTAPGHAHAHHDAATTDHHSHTPALASTPHGDCTDHADGGAADSHCKTCTVCQTCHTVAITLPPTGAVGTEPPTALPLLADPRFASADRAPGFKPPIS